MWAKFSFTSRTTCYPINLCPVSARMDNRLEFPGGNDPNCSVHPLFTDKVRCTAPVVSVNYPSLNSEVYIYTSGSVHFCSVR